MPPIDIRTLLLTIAVANLASAVLLVAYGRANPIPRAGRAFFAAKVVLAAGWALLTMRGLIAEDLSRLVGNLALLTGLALEFLAVALFLRPIRRVGRALGLYWLVACVTWAGAYWSGIDARLSVILASWLAAPFFLGIAALLLHPMGAAPPTPLNRGLGLLNLAVGLAIVARGGMAAVGTGFALLDPVPIQMVSIASVTLITFVNGIGFLLIAMERDVHALTESHEQARRSSQDLAAVLDNMVDVFYRRDSSGRIVMVSRSIETVLGYSAAEVIGTPAGDYYWDDDDRRRLHTLLEENGGVVANFEVRLRHRDGYPVWVSSSVRVLPGNGEERPALEGVIHDISDRKAAEDEVIENRAMVQALLDASGEGTFLMDRDGRLLAANAVFAGRFGRGVAEIVGTCVWDLFPEDLIESRRRVAADVFATARPIHLRDSRNGRHLDAIVQPVVRADGTCDKIAVYSRDITDAIEAEQRIAHYIEDIRRSNTELEQFAFIVSHDLREPIRMVSSFLGLLERRLGEGLDPQSLEYLRFSRDGARRMDRMVQDLLAFARIGQSVATEAVRIDEVVQLAIANLRVAIDEAQARIVLPANWPVVRGDHGEMVRLFQNLLGNAVKFRSPTRPPRIEIVWKAEDGWIEIQVRDNGIGLSPEHGERIFDIFQRLVTRDQYEGTGIGLALCRKIVEKQGGTIRVESRPDAGATFRLTLPVAASPQGRVVPPPSPVSAPVRAMIAATRPELAASQESNSATISGLVRDDRR